MRTAVAFPVLVVACLTVTRALGQGNPITNGGFEQLDAAGRPADWSLMAPFAIETADVHSGAHALRLTLKLPGGPDPGLNRAWGENSGQRDGMVDRVKGGIRFWYKANSADAASGLVFVVIPMSGVPREVGVGRARWTVPSDHVGDGQWHQGAFAYDYSANADVKWVHVGIRLYTDNVDLLVDDFKWVPEVGPVLSLGALEITESPGSEGESCQVAVAVKNVGDAPLPAGRAVLLLPDGLSAEPPEAATPTLGPQEDATVPFRVTGRRTALGAAIEATATAAGQTASGSVKLEAKLSSLRLAAERMLVRLHEPTVVRLLGRNDGTAILQAPRASLSAPEGLQIEPIAGLREALPGAESELAAWRVSVDEPSLNVPLVASVAGLALVARTQLVAPERMPEPPAIDGGAYARVTGDQAVIGTRSTRLALARQPAGWGVGVLQCRRGRWRPLALLPRLGLVATPEHEVPVMLRRASASGGGDAATLLLEGSLRVSGQVWAARVALTARAGGDLIGYELRLTPAVDSGILAIEGPMLYAGELGGDAREDAILPGLEWLIAGEDSSSALDFRPEHPDRVRNVPHPYKVTVPAVGMKLGDSVLGLLWDSPNKQNLPEAMGPESVVFSSPNRLQGPNNHLVGLMLPGAGIGMPENAMRAEKPLPVQAGQELVLRADLLAAPEGRDSLVALDRWFQLHGYPEPLPMPRGDARSELAFSLRGYSKQNALWNPEWGCWYSDLIVGFNPDRGPAHELLIGSRVLGDGVEAQQAAALAGEVMGADERQRAYALEFRSSAGALGDLAARARGLIASQDADGTWRFSGKHAKAGWTAEAIDYDYLGAEGASEVGLSAPSAAAVLEYALLSGDGQAEKAGLAALKAMRQFRVPRAAQVWECPVHSPDILASSVAIDAYLLGYELTGEREYLEDAIYWARTGLPFVYVWNAPDQPVMHGASIPIFGATAYGLSWLGVAVQWNGMAYADSLRNLARYDGSFCWDRVAQNLLVSGMYQQATEGDRLAQWPDAMNFIVGRPGLHGQTPPCFKPTSLIYASLDEQNWWHSTPRIRCARRGRERIALRSPADLARIKWDRDALRFEARFAKYQWGAVEAVGVSRPTEVRVDGRTIAEAADLAAADGPAWRYHGGIATLEVRLTRPGSAWIEALGVTRAPVTVVVERIDFGFDADPEGWAPASGLSAFTVRDGVLATEVTGADPYMTRGSLSVPGQAADILVLTMSSTSQGGTSLYFGNETGGFDPARTMGVDLPADGQMHTVRVPVGDHAQWAGHTITALRIDPGSGEQAGAVRIDSVRLERGK